MNLFPDDYSDYFYFPAAGERNSSGSPAYRGVSAAYWSSTGFDPGNGRHFYFNASNCNLNQYNRAYAYSIRCVAHGSRTCNCLCVVFCIAGLNKTHTFVRLSKRSTTMDLKEITLQVCRIAKDTGMYLSTERKNFRKENVLEKHSHDYVSYVDQEAEKITVKALNALLPEAGFITEEGTIKQSNAGLNWVIDPLDGTTNFIHDHAPYCVSIALRRDEELLIGVVYEVCRDECFYAWKGGKAYLNDKQMYVSNNEMESAFIGLELPYNADGYKPVIINAFDKLYGNVSSIRISGSAASSLCYVASGRYDGWGEAFISAWDYSAGVLIVREAGGMVTDFTGKEDITGTHHVVATNGIIHEKLRNVFILD